MANGPLVVLAFLLFAAIAIAAGVLAWRAEKRRMAALAAAARRLGIAFNPGGWRGRSWSLSFLQRGSRRLVRHVATGTYRGVGVASGEYSYVTGNGKSQQTHRGVFALAEVTTEWPKLTIVPETLALKVFDALGGDDIDFESDEFSRRFWVKSTDRKFAYDVIHPRMMDHLMEPGWRHWEIAGRIVSLHEEPGTMKPELLQASLDRVVDFVGLVPSFLHPPKVQPVPGAAVSA